MDINPNTFQGRVARSVAEAIESSGVTVVWLCEKSGIPRTTMTRRLAGNSSFTVDELDRVANALRVPVETLTPSSDTRGAA